MRYPAAHHTERGERTSAGIQAPHQTRLVGIFASRVHSLKVLRNDKIRTMAVAVGLWCVSDIFLMKALL